MDNKQLTDKEYWKKQASRFKPFAVTSNEFEPVLRKHLPVNPGLTCAEIGAYPGHYLCYMAKTFKYIPTAIEFRDDVEDIERLFAYNEISGLSIINSDFLKIKGQLFDIVMSIGFIEHFTDYQTVIRRHVEMMNPGGYLIIGVPRFEGLQAILRKLIFNTEALAELYATHNLKIMNLAELKKNLRAAGLKILHLDYAMGGSFWIPADSPKIKPGMKWLAKILAGLQKKILPGLPPSFYYSPMIFSIAKKI